MDSEKSRWVAAWVYEEVGSGKGHIQESRMGKRDFEEGWYAHYLHCGVSFLSVFTCQNLPNCTLNMQFIACNSASVKLFFKSFVNQKGFQAHPLKHIW